MGIAALVLGIIAFVLAITFVLAPLGVVLAVIGLILGIVDIVKKGKTGEKKAIGMAGMILSAVMFIVLMVESFFILVGVASFGIISDYDANRINSSIESSTIETFNSKFLGYEGSQTGSRVKIVLNNISINNSYNEHEIDVYYNGQMKEPDVLKQEIGITQEYTITFYKDIDGYINKVYIISSYGSTTNNNSNSNNLTNKTTNLL